MNSSGSDSLTNVLSGPTYLKGRGGFMQEGIVSSGEITRHGKLVGLVRLA